MEFLADEENRRLFLQGYFTTIALWAGAFAVSLVIGLIVASARVWGNAILQAYARGYVEFFRNTPLLVQLAFYATLLAPNNLGVTGDPMLAALIGLGIYTGAYTTEAIRSGILSVDARQIEAARSLGLSQFQALRLVVLPQAVRTVIPPLGNLAIALVKNTAVATGIAAVELLQAARILEGRPPYIFPFVALLLGYWSLTLPLAWAVNRVERRLGFAR
jgi:His/Glu/Gln/Arg/opine family amino acid ABC transporter permease subunit